jgi:hypothetical protein
MFVSVPENGAALELGLGSAMVDHPVQNSRQLAMGGMRSRDS